MRKCCQSFEGDKHTGYCLQDGHLDQRDGHDMGKADIERSLIPSAPSPTVNDPVVKDRGPRVDTTRFPRDIASEGAETKETLGGGATRTKSLVRFDLIPATTDYRTALRFGQGAAKHGEGNWQGGDWTFVVSCVGHLRAHLNTMIREGNAADDNIGAMLWNCHAMGWYETNKPAEFAKAMLYLLKGQRP